MASLTRKLYLSYSQLCVFLTSLDHPFNYWSDRNYSQGFAWRRGSASFRALVEDGDHQINIFINEAVPAISENCVRCFLVPFDASDGNIEIASISDSIALQIPSGDYALQVEFISVIEGVIPEVNVRLNIGSYGYAILKADDMITIEGDYDLMAEPAD
jgi:hypothetical protein